MLREYLRFMIWLNRLPNVTFRNGISFRNIYIKFTVWNTDTELVWN